MGSIREIDMLFLAASVSEDMPRLQKMYKNGEVYGKAGKVCYDTICKPEGYNALHLAARAGKTEACRFLIENLKFDVNGAVEASTNDVAEGLRRSHLFEVLGRLSFGEIYCQLRSRFKKVAPLAKTKGGEAFRKKHYADAIQWYTQAATCSGPKKAKVLMNRSLCYVKMDMGEEALADAQTCTALEPGWGKAHYREGAALNACKKFDKAAESFSRALALHPGNKEIDKAYQEVQASCSKFSHWYED